MGIRLRRDSRRFKAALSGSMAAAVIVGLLPLASGPLFPVTAQATVANHLVFTSQPGDGDPNSDLATMPQVTVEDSSDKAVDSSATVTLTIKGPAGADIAGLSPTLACDDNPVTASSGVADFSGCQVNRGGIYSLSATDSDGDTSAVSSNFFISGPAQLAFTGQPSGGTAGVAWTTQQPQVTVEDAHGTAIGDSTASIRLAIVSGTGATGATLTCTTNPLAATSGVSSFSGCAIDKIHSGYQLVATDSTDSLISPPSDAFGITAGAPAHVVFLSGPSSLDKGGTAFVGQPTVAVEDAANNVITGNSDTIQLAITSGTGTAGAALTCTDTSLAASDGEVSFAGCSIDKAGNGYQLTATDTTASPNISGDSVALDVAVGSPARIQFTTSPGGGAPNTAFDDQPVVQVTDAGGNPEPGSVLLSIATGTGTTGAGLGCLLDPVSLDASGNATFSGCQITLPGSGYKLHAVSGTLSTDSGAFTITGTGPAANAAFSTPQPGGGSGGAEWTDQPVVTLTDAGGSPASGAVTLAITDGTGAPGATLHCAQNPVNAGSDGVATFTGCAIDRAASDYTLTATSGAAHATSDPFDITVGAADHLAFTQEPGGGTGGIPWDSQPVVQVQDAGGNQVTDSTATVSLSVTEGSGSGALTCTANSLPAVHGSAQFSNCSIDKAGASYTLTAQATGLGDGVSDVFPVQVGPPARLLWSNQPGGGPAGVAWSAQPAVTIADAGGNTVGTSSSSIALSIAPGSGTGGATLSCDSNPLGASDGVAAFTSCSIDTAAGGYSLIAGDAGDSLSAESHPLSILLPPPGPLGLAPQDVPLAQTFGGRTYGSNPTDIVDDVNTASGDLTFGVTDLNVAGIGEPFSLKRTYNSMDNSSGVFGPGWTSLLDVSVNVVKNQTAVVRGEDGQQLVWTWNSATNTWVAPPGAQGSLQCSAKACSFTRNDGVTWDVSLTQPVGQIQDYLNPDGQGLHFTWASGRVTVTVASTNRQPYNVTVTLDGSNHVTSVTTPAGRTVSYGYATGLLSSVTDATGHIWTYGYDTSGRLTSMTDPLGNDRLDARYDGGGRVSAVQIKGGPQHADDTFTRSSSGTSSVSVRHALSTFGTTTGRESYTDAYQGNVLVQQSTPAGAVTRFSYDANLNLIESQDPLGWVSQYGFDAANNLISQSTPITATSSATTHMTYDAQHRLLTQTDADGNTVTYVYNGPYLGFIRPPNVTPGTSYTYNKLGELVEVDGPLGKALYSYDALGNQTVVLQQTLGGAALNGKGTRNTYDEAGDIISSVDPRGTSGGSASAFTTTHVYDANGRLLSTTTPGPQTSSTTYTAAGDVQSTTDAAGHTTSYAWDEPTLTRTTTTAGGASSTQVYDASGNLLSETSPGNRTTTHVLDDGGREISTTDASNVTARFAYDIEGNVVAITDSTGQSVTRDYDSLNRVIREVDDGAATLTGYDPAGHVVSQTAPSGSVTTSTYDAYGNMTSVHDANGTTSYTYDADANLLTRTDPDGNVTSYTYDGANRQTSMATAGATTTYGYDVAGNVKTIVDPDGRTTTYTLDALNHPLTTKYTQTGHPSITVTQAFDALGRRTSMTDATGTHTYGYDVNGNLTSASVPGNGSFTWDYTSQPGKILETYPDGTNVTYATDDTGNLMSVTSGTQGTSNYVSANYVRNPERQTVGIAFGNGVYEARQTDVLGDILRQSLTMGSTLIADTAYSYDAGRNRLAQVDDVLGHVTTDTYNYSTTGRLTAFSTNSTVVGTHTTSTPPPPLGTPTTTTGGTAPFAGTGNAAPFTPQSPTALSPSYSYDGNGNMLSGNGLDTTYGSADQITGQTGTGAAPYTYDHAGNVTAKGDTGYSYDAAGHLVSVSTPNGTVTYTYDGDGNRVSRTAGVVTKFVWDPAGPVPLLAIEESGSNHLIRRYINGEGPVALQTSLTTLYMHLDPQGTVTELTNPAGAVVAAYHYDGFGNLLSTDPADAPTQPVLFQGQLYDSTTGLYYMRARDYDPSTGRFIRRDPVTPPTGTPAVSPYAFVGDQPTLFTDATGMTAMPTATDIFWGKSTFDANVTEYGKYAALAIKVGIKAKAKYAAYLAEKAASKMASVIDRLSGDIGTAVGESAEGLAEGAGRAELRFASSEVAVAAESSAKFGDAAKFLGPALDVVGIGLQVFITVEDCEHGTVSRCVGDALGTAISIGFTVGCTILTEGIGAVACGIVGGIISVAVAEVVARFGPQIADFAVSVYKDAAAGIESAATTVATAVVGYYNVVAGGIDSAIGAISTGIDKATAAISSGFNTAINALVDAGYTALQLGETLKNAFDEGVKDTVAALVNFGYQVEDIAGAVAGAFSLGAQEAAQLFKDAFNDTADEVMGVLKDVYNLGDEAAATILKGVSYAVDEVGKALKDVYGEAADVVGPILKDIGYAAQQIGAVFQHVFDEVDTAVAVGLKALGYAAEVVGAALNHLFNDIDSAMASALKFATYAADEIATALHQVFADVGQVAATILKNLSFAAGEVMGALDTVYHALDQAAAQILENVGYVINDVAAALDSVYDDIDSTVATVLHNLGNAVTDIADALHSVFTSDPAATVAALLKDVGFLADDIASGLRSAFTTLLADTDVATILKDLLFDANAVAGALESAFGDAAQAAAAALKTVGYAIDEIAGALQTVFGEAAEAAATVLKAIGYTAAEIGSALADVFNLVGNAIASVLNDIGESLTDIANYLEDAWGEATSDIANFFSSIGISSDLIDQIGGAFASFGQSVEDCFSSFFSDC